MSSTLRAWWLLALIVAIPAAAQVTRPDHAGRIVRSFDFEGPVVGTIRLPEHWIRAQHDPGVPRDRPGFPIWNAAELDDSVAYSGTVSVRVPVEGGSASLRLNAGVIPVFPGADYLIGVKVRTENAVGARARLVARFLDAASIPIHTSERTSRLVRTRGDWTALGVTLYGDHRNAAFIQIDLELVQTREYLEPRLGEHQVYHDDHDATAWFDDVVVMQLPRVELSTPAPFNLILEQEEPTVEITVRDLTGQALDGVVRVLDDRGREVDRIERQVPPGRFSETWAPRLPRLGWYRAVLELSKDGTLVGATYLDFAWILDTSDVTDGTPTLLTPESSQGAGRLGGGSVDRGRFGVDIQSMDGGLMTTLPELAKRLGVGSVTVPAWSADTTGANVEARAFALTRLVAALAEDWVETTLAFSRVPDELAAIVRVRAADPLELVTATDPALWRVYTDPILDQLGPRVSRWQIGPAGDDAAFWIPTIANTIEPVDRLLLSMVTTPRVVLPWRADRALREIESPVEGTDSATALLIPQSFGVEAIKQLGASIDGQDDLTVVLEALPVSDYRPRDLVDDLVKRAVTTWGAFDHETMTRLDILEPWRLSDTRRAVIMPRPEAAAWRNLIERLAERRHIGSFPGMPGIRCEILDDMPGAESGRGGVLVAWREPGFDGETVLEAPLGEGNVRVIDVYGNEHTVSPEDRAHGSHVHVVPITDSPVFIEDVDAKMVRFVAGFRMEPTLVPSTNEAHPVTLTLTNPWPMRVSGELYIVQPGGAFDGETADRSWQIKPRAQRYSIAANESIELPLTMAFSPYEESGAHELIVEASISAQRDIESVRLIAPFEIGLADLSMDVSYRKTPTAQGPNLIIDVMVRNSGDTEVIAELRAFPPQMARMRLPTVAIGPGQTIERRFMIEDGAELLAGTSVSVNLSEVDGGGSLNRRIQID